MTPSDLLFLHLRESGFYAFERHWLEYMACVDHVYPDQKHVVYAPAGIWVFRSRWKYYWGWVFGMSEVKFAVINRVEDRECMIEVDVFG